MESLRSAASDAKEGGVGMGAGLGTHGKSKGTEIPVFFWGMLDLKNKFRFN